MTLLLLKIGLVPCLVALASLAARRFGPKLGGWVAGFPIVAGPILFFFAWEQGARFAAGAAEATLTGIVSLAGFALTYGWMATRSGWTPSLLVSWGAFGAMTWLLRGWDATWPVGLVVAVVAIHVTLRAMPRTALMGDQPRATRADLPLRMAATAGLVLALTAAASWLGPRWSGLLTPFPVATTVLVVFGHRERGAAAAERVLRGLLLALQSFAAFCAILAVALPRLGIAAAFALALLASLTVQLLLLRLVRQRS